MDTIKQITKFLNEVQSQGVNLESVISEVESGQYRRASELLSEIAHQTSANGLANQFFLVCDDLDKIDKSVAVVQYN